MQRNDRAKSQMKRRKAIGEEAWSVETGATIMACREMEVPFVRARDGNRKKPKCEYNPNNVNIYQRARSGEYV